MIQYETLYEGLSPAAFPVPGLVLASSPLPSASAPLFSLHAPPTHTIFIF